MSARKHRREEVKSASPHRVDQRFTATAGRRYAGGHIKPGTKLAGGHVAQPPQHWARV